MFSSRVSTVQEKNKIPSLDGLRGLAIILVITFHYFGRFSLFSLGWSGVDLFFVLSGYLITMRLMENRDKPDRFLRFYRNRALRIMPLYYLALAVFFITLVFFVSAKNLYRFDFYKENWAGFLLFFQNWTLIFEKPPVEVHLQHFWSLAIEEQFYLLWPFLVYSFSLRTGFYKMIWFVIAGVVVLRCTLYFFIVQDTPIFFYNTFCRMDSFLTGAVIYLMPKRGTYKPLLLNLLLITSLVLLITGLVITGNSSHTSPFFKTVGYTILAFIFGGILFKIVERPSSIFSRIFNLRFLRHAGKISYGLYIIHWPVLQIAGFRIQSFLHVNYSLTKTTTMIASAFCCLLITYGLSVLSFKYFETFFLRFKK